MRCKHYKSFMLAIAAVLLFSAGAWARDHRQDVNGTWKLIPTRSELNGEPAIESGTVTSDDHGGKIHLAQNFAFAAPTESASANFTLEGRENNVIRSGGSFWGIANWSNDTLQVSVTDNSSNSTERLSLEPDGTMVMNFERSGHRPVRLFFERER